MKNFNELPIEQEQFLDSNSNETKPDNINIIKNLKLLKSLLLGLVLVVGPGQAKSEDTRLEQKPDITAVDSSNPETIKKVKTGLAKLIEGDNFEKRWLAESALREIELNEFIAERLTKKYAKEELPIDYLKGFIKDVKLLEDLNKQALKNFQKFHYDKNGKETKEYLELSFKERSKLLHQFQAECIYDYFVQTEGLGIANLRVLKAEKHYKQEQEKRAIESFKKIMDMQEGKYVLEYPDWLKSALRENKIEPEKDKAEEITLENAQEIRELIESLLDISKE